jgi:hypothetical protein
MNKIPGKSSLLYSYLNEPEIIYPSIESTYGQIYDKNDSIKPNGSDVQSNLFSNPIDLTLVVKSISPILITMVPDRGSTIGYICSFFIDCVVLFLYLCLIGWSTFHV